MHKTNRMQSIEKFSEPPFLEILDPPYKLDYQDTLWCDLEVQFRDFVSRSKLLLFRLYAYIINFDKFNYSDMMVDIGLKFCLRTSLTLRSRAWTSNLYNISHFININFNLHSYILL